MPPTLTTATPSPRQTPATSSPTALPGAPAPASSGLPTWVWVLLAGAAGGLLGWLLYRRQSRQEAESEEDAPPDEDERP